MNFKATSFLGVFSIRNGCLFASAFQIITGVVIWQVLDFLRPMLRWFNLIIGLWFMFGGIFGLVLTHTNLSSFWAALERSEVLMWLYNIHLGSCLAILFLLLLDFGDFAHILPAPPTKPSTEITPPIVAEIENAAAGIEQAALHPIAKLSGNETAASSSLIEKELTRFRELFPENVHRFFTRGPLRHFNRDFAVFLGQGAPESTDGETLEISKKELPAEYNTLPTDLKSVVSAGAKEQKHLVKFVAAGIVLVLLVGTLYNMWITFTFVSNKCVSLDEVEEQPDQFQPLMSRPV